MPYCRPYAPGLSVDARRNRDLLIDTMESVGFSNCVDEYWHYSYGDSAWAVRMGQPVSWYGLIEPSSGALHEYERLVARVNRKEDSRRRRECARWIALADEFQTAARDLAQSGKVRIAFEMAFQTFELSLRALFVAHTGSFPKDLGEWASRFEESFVHEQVLPVADLKKVQRSVESWRRIHDDPDAVPKLAHIESMLAVAAYLRKRRE
jgi:hypothetical protein